MLACFAAALMPAAVLAHGVAPEPTSLLSVALAWSLEPHIVLPLAGLWLAYWAAVRAVAREHPANPVPRWRAWSWYAGLGALLIALASPVATYDTTLFSVHMAQHVLLVLVAVQLTSVGILAELVVNRHASEDDPTRHVAESTD